MKRTTKKGGRIILGHPTKLWKQFHGLIKHGNPHFDTFRVSPKETKESYKKNNIESIRSFVLSSLPYKILKGTDYLKIDKTLSRLSHDEIGPYLFLCGIK